MRTYGKNFITGLLMLVLGFGAFAMPSPVFAEGEDNLVVNFESTPLFGEANFLPGESVSRTVEVVNNTPDTQTIITQAFNVVNDNGLGEVLVLEITEGATTLFDGTLAEFFAGGETVLSDLAGGESSTTYLFTVTFPEGVGNDTQGAGLDFDLLVGFQGGESEGDGDNGDNGGGGGGGDNGDNGGGDNGGGGGGSGGGGGGGGGPIETTPLLITNETAIQVDQTGTVLITWDTNFHATSQVIYGLASGGPYSINITEPHFGYAASTPEDATKVLDHSVSISGLVIGETYLYRAVSKASPPTVGLEHSFTLVRDEDGNIVVVPGGPFGGTGGSGGGGSGTGDGTGASGSGNTFLSQATGEGGNGGDGAGAGNGGANGSETGTTSEEEIDDNRDQLAAAGLFGNPLNIIVLILLILLLLLLLWLVWKQRQKEDEGENADQPPLIQ